MFIRFFTESGSGLSAIKGTYNDKGEPQWEAVEVQPDGSMVNPCK